jgi:hypothetical protein
VNADHHFGRIRRIVTFLLGVTVIIDALTRNVHAVAEIFAGLLLLGVVPAEEWLNRWPRYNHHNTDRPGSITSDRSPVPPARSDMTGGPALPREGAAGPGSP